MKEKIWNIGIIGLGAAAAKHAEAIEQLSNARLLAVQSTSLEKRRDWIRKYRCEAYVNPRDLCMDGRIDIVLICNPSGLHGDAAVLAMRTGHHVIVEKPLEITLPKCDMIINCERETGKRCFTVFQNRFSDINRTIKKAIVSGRLGTVTSASAYQKWWRDPEYYGKDGWRGTKSLDGGGCLMNQSIHALDLLIWLAGDISSVSAMKTNRFHHEMETEDTLVSAIEYESGALGTIECSTASYPGTERRIEIRGTEGSIIAEDDRLVLWCFRNETEDDEIIRRHFSSAMQNRASEDPMAFPAENHRRQLESILKSLEENGPSETDSHAGRKAVEAVTAIYESAETDMRIWL